jgi:hypothetical protein
MGPAEVVDFLGQIVFAAHSIDDFIETGQNGVGLTQEVAVLHQIGHGDIGEERELLLVFRMGLKEADLIENEISAIMLCSLHIAECICLPEENLGSDISITLSLIPRAADDVALLRAKDSRVASITAIGTADSRHSFGGHSCARLSVKFNFSQFRNIQTHNIRNITI